MRESLLFRKDSNNSASGNFSLLFSCRTYMQKNSGAWALRQAGTRRTRVISDGAPKRFGGPQ